MNVEKQIDSVMKRKTKARAVVRHKAKKIVLHAQPIEKVVQSTSVLRQTFRFVLASPLLLILILSTFVIPLAAFEAHVINVTAVIEDRPFCDALSIGYWRNHEGCSKGTGDSIWTSQINNLSTTEFSGVFSGFDGAAICNQLWVPNCPGGNSVGAKLCKAKAHTLADELNVVSNRLQLRALIAGADDGSSAFDNLGLSESSRVDEALTKVEEILADNSSTVAQITDADHVAERIYAFYEEENPLAPLCVFSLGSLPEVNTKKSNSKSNSLLQSNNASLISSTGELVISEEESSSEEGGVIVEISPEVEIILETGSTSSLQADSTTSTSSGQASSPQADSTTSTSSVQASSPQVDSTSSLQADSGTTSSTSVESISTSTTSTESSDENATTSAESTEPLTTNETDNATSSEPTTETTDQTAEATDSTSSPQATSETSTIPTSTSSDSSVGASTTTEEPTPSVDSGQATPPEEPTEPPPPEEPDPSVDSGQATEPEPEPTTTEEPPPTEETSEPT